MSTMIQAPLPAPAAPPTRRTGGGRIAAIVSGSLLVLVALGLLAIGGFLLWANGEKDGQGYLKTSSHRFATSTYALTTANLDVSSGAPDWLVNSDRYGKIRLAVDARHGKPVFVGIAPTADVSRYLGSAPHATVTDVEYSPFHADYRTHRGGGRPASPAQQHIWAASVQGSGRQTLTWDVKHGSWSIVVMNADGSRGVAAGVSAGADVPILPTLAWSSLGGGALLLGAGAVLLVLGLRRRA